jgi:hypothetical protein
MRARGAGRRKVVRRVEESHMSYPEREEEALVITDSAE